MVVLLRYRLSALLVTGTLFIALFTHTNLNQPSETLFWSLLLDQQHPQQWWRVLSAHWLHTDVEHLIWNLLGLALLAGLIEAHSRLMLLYTLFIASLGVAIWFFALSKADYYCGWSGVLNGFLVVAMSTLWQSPSTDTTRAVRQLNNFIVSAVLLGAFIKILFELNSTATVLSVGVWPTAVGAHLAGYLSGVLILMFRRVWPEQSQVSQARCV